MQREVLTIEPLPTSHWKEKKRKESILQVPVAKYSGFAKDKKEEKGGWFPFDLAHSFVKEQQKEK